MPEPDQMPGRHTGLPDPQLQGEGPGMHDHEWHLIAYFDGCHFEERHHVCWTEGCNAHQRTYNERDLASYPFARAFFRDDCARCGLLDTGARPIRDLTDIIEGSGADEH